MYSFGRASIIYKSGKQSKPCQNCGQIHATMYEVGLSKTFNGPPNLVWVLCVFCRSDLERLFCEQSKLVDGY